MQAVLLDILQHPHFASHLTELCNFYGERYKSLAGLLKQYLPANRFQPVDGGMFIWLELLEGDSMSLAQEALSEGVAVVPSRVFYLADESINNKPQALRLNFTHANAEVLRDGVQRLAKVIPCPL